MFLPSPRPLQIGAPTIADAPGVLLPASGRPLRASRSFWQKAQLANSCAPGKPADHSLCCRFLAHARSLPENRSLVSQGRMCIVGSWSTGSVDCRPLHLLRTNFNSGLSAPGGNFLRRRSHWLRHRGIWGDPRRTRGTHSTATRRPHELHQLLAISASSARVEIGKHFLQAFVVRAADFLGLAAAFIAVAGDDVPIRYLGGEREFEKAGGRLPAKGCHPCLRRRGLLDGRRFSKDPGANLEVSCATRSMSFFCWPTIWGRRRRFCGMFGVCPVARGHYRFLPTHSPGVP